MMQESRRKSLQVAMGLTLLLLLQFKSTESANISRPGCPKRCGNVEIPYPFGVGTNCSMSEHFNITCKPTETNTSIPYLYADYEIQNLILSLGQARIKIRPMFKWYNRTIQQELGQWSWGLYWDMRPYWVNHEKNKLAVFGCNTLGYLVYNASNPVRYDPRYPMVPLPPPKYSTPLNRAGCLSTCMDKNSLYKYGQSCSGLGCCKTALPYGTNSFELSFDKNYISKPVRRFAACSFAMLIEDDYPGLVFNLSNACQLLIDSATTIWPPLTDGLNVQSMPVLFNWAIGNTTCIEAQANRNYACKSLYSECVDVNSSSGVGYICNCSKGYEGNPYLDGGCQDIDECNATATKRIPCSKPAKCHNLPGYYSCSCPVGWLKRDDNTCQLNLKLIIGSIIGSCAATVAISFMGFAIYVVMERRNLSKIKEKFFQQHGGWILLEKIKSNQGFGFTIFTEQQIEQATNNFDSTNIIGHGGQGTVYKGTLRDQTVAIKKCKLVDESKKKEFGKEMLILSQISHKNIVKLLGCCLEVEVPILVYEFISNGTLFHYIHNKRPRSPILLIARLKIAHESAQALAYLHTTASPPIFHGDVKSSNILLDQNYTAKVSDFGASILVPTDAEQFVTFVQGTCGYLDPEYLQSCQLTDKSDVYSFGVVLVELLTSKPVIDFDAPEEKRSLSSCFISAMKENKLQDLLDNEIKNEDEIDLIREVAELAVECLSMKGEERPTMEEVAEELHRIIKLKQHPWKQNHQPEETTSLLGGRSRYDMEIEYSS